MPITDFLEKNASLYTNEISLIERRYDGNNAVFKEQDSSQKNNNSNSLSRKTLTWGEFDRRANQVANLLLSNNIKQGNKVALLMTNCLEWLPIYFGILKTGALAVPLNFRYTSYELQYCLSLAECSVLIFTSDFTERVTSIRYQIPMVSQFIFVGNNPPNYSANYDDLIETFNDTRPNIMLMDTDFAAIYFSSGTTGFPKAILHTHEALLAAGQAEQHHHKQTHEDIFLCIPPLYHTGAKMHWFGSLISGSPAVLLCNISPRWILETMSQEHATIVWLLLPWVQDILDAISSGDISIENYDFSHWRLTHMGAQPIPPQVVKNWFRVFPNQQFDINYGLTESGGPGCVHLGVNNAHKLGSIGKAGYGWETLIVSDEGSSVQHNVIGELSVKGNGLMVGYYKDPEATTKTLRDGWLLTGDMAYEDEDGFIHLVGRKKDLIISGGENIYPIEIENFLKTNQKVKDAVVIGCPNDRLGEEIVAIIEIKFGFQCGKAEMKKFCMDLPPYKRPYKFIFAPIPRNPTGKVEKEKLRKQCSLESIW